MGFTKEKIEITIEKLKSLIYEPIIELKQVDYLACGYKENSKIPDLREFQPFDLSTVISGKDRHFWFHLTYRTPKAIPDRKIYFHLDFSQAGTWDALNPQSLVYLNGTAVQGLDINHRDVPLAFETDYDMYLYFYTGMSEEPLDICIVPRLILCDVKTEQLYYDMMVPYEAMRTRLSNSDEAGVILKHLELAANMIDFRVCKSQNYDHSIEEAGAFLQREFYHGICKKNEVVVDCIGHTHIDVAWLWTLAQTKEKAQRSFSTVISLMKEYPEFQFMSSQPQLYQYVKEADPALYAEIQEAVRSGRWEVEGGMWLEADCNLISGESMIRQILYGKKFMMDEFQKDSTILWLPDVFGYSAAMPQILKKCGITKFVTSKISWNETNRLPYDSFLWQGLDGSEIFTYFLTAQDSCEGDPFETRTTYVGYIRPKQVYGTWKRYQQKDYHNRTLLTFGFGDGGGGPTRDMLEQQRRLQAGIPGVPRTEITFAGKFLDTAYEAFEKNCKLLKRTPKWVGELYLELHRGTFTSMARNKKYNRKAEFLYQEAEMLSVTDSVLTNGVYPTKDLHENWQNILLLQFHDIIPGSSIAEVYQDSDQIYQSIFQHGEDLVDEKLNTIFSNIETEGGLAVYNPNAFTADGTVLVNGKTAYVKDIPALGWAVTHPKTGAAHLTVDTRHLENRFFKISFSENGEILSIYDKQNNRELIKHGFIANQMEVYEDFPKCYDAWEISDYYSSKMWIADERISIETVQDGVRAGLKTVIRFLDSLIDQTIYLYDDIARIDFDTTIDWKQEHLLLKTSFPFDIHANEATYDIQFGHIKRPTHANTSWDAAKFEVCAHKWADISDAGYGVSLINDCKYGHSADGSTLKLTLLKSATYPNPTADQEIHTFTYSLYPHKGDFRSGGTIQRAYAFNKPFRAVEIPKQDGILPEIYSLVSCTNPNIVIETVKQAENDSSIIVRAYEAYDQKTDAVFRFGFDFSRAYLCDMLENNLCEIAKEDRNLTISLKNFEIITIKIIR